MESNPLTLTLYPEGRGDEVGGSVVVPPTPTLPHKGGGSEENGDEYSDTHHLTATTGVVALQSNPAITGGIAPQSQGPSSLSVTIEDEKGNLIEISRREGDKPAGPASPALQVTEDAGSVVLIWQGMDQSKGFIIHRSEKDKGNYVPISGLIPYFGVDGKEIFLYRFKDNGMKPGTKYDYRLEVVKSTQQKDRPEGPSTISGQSLSLRSSQ